MSYHIGNKTGLTKQEWKREARNSLDKITIYFSLPLMALLAVLSWRMS